MNAFKMLRKEKKLTQIELAHQLGIDQTTVSKWELDKALPDTTMLIKLAEFFDVSTDFLLSRSSFYYPDKLNQTTEEQLANGLSSDECDIIQKYRELNANGKKLVKTVIDTHLATMAEGKQHRKN